MSVSGNDITAGTLLSVGAIILYAGLDMVKGGQVLQGVAVCAVGAGIVISALVLHSKGILSNK